MRLPECKFVKKWFNVTDSVPHVSLYVGKNWEAKDLGPMMKKAEQSKWEPTENQLIFHSADKNYIQILYITKFNGNSSGNSYQSKEPDANDYNI